MALPLGTRARRRAEPLPTRSAARDDFQDLRLARDAAGVTTLGPLTPTLTLSLALTLTLALSLTLQVYEAMKIDALTGER